MYCPHCATWHDGGVSRCTTCDRDLQPVVAALAAVEPTNTANEALRAAQHERWQRQRHSFGLLLVLCSLLIGCLIPISLGLFSGLAWLGALVTLLAGVAGLLLLLGAMLLLAAEGQILTSIEPQDSMGRPALPLHDLEPQVAGDRGRQGLAAHREG
jgi:hypothetical protein